MYSDMSMRVTARAASKRKSASARASSVLPTPVGPRNRNEPMGRCGSERPARPRRVAPAAGGGARAAGGAGGGGGGGGAGAGAAGGVGGGGDGLVLADDPLVQVLLEPEQLC